MTKNYFTTAVRTALACAWTSTAAFAATDAVDAVVKQVTWTSAMLVVVLAMLSGLSALLWRLDKELNRRNGNLPRPVMFASMHMVGSLVMGLLAFFVSMGRGLSGWDVLIAVVVSAFAGAAALERVAETMVRRWLLRDGDNRPYNEEQSNAD